jgi:carboxyvinyl-carboxyphosphonate phosphorylmutase
MKLTTRFRQLLEAPDILVAPSAYDALSAQVIKHAGFQTIHMTGSGSSASLLGYPDLGFTTISEMATHAKNMVLATGLPVVVDADTGYGNALNVIRTVRELERAGVVAVHLEDQTTPKRCGHLEGKALISTEEMAKKIEAAVYAREDPDFTIIARTDVRESQGMEAALERADAYVSAGADCVFVEAPLTVDELRQVANHISVPVLANMVEGGKTPWLTFKELEDLGYAIVIYPLSGWMAAAAVLRELMRELQEKGTTQEFWKSRGLEMTFEELFEVFDYSEIQRLEHRFVPR